MKTAILQATVSNSLDHCFLIGFFGLEFEACPFSVTAKSKKYVDVFCTTWEINK